jgi:hypothetical protein
VHYVLRPSFKSLAACESECGPVFGLVQRAAKQVLPFEHAVSLVWYSLPSGHGLTRPVLEKVLVSLPPRQRCALTAALGELITTGAC